MKPFNLAHARAGAPVAVDDGQEATIIKFDGRNQAFPLVVLVGINDNPRLANNKGIVSFGPMNPCKRLVMPALAIVQEKPVYFGDMLIDPTGREVLVYDNKELNADWSWPDTPADDGYPKTQMSEQELAASFNNPHMAVGLSLKPIANAAIRHGIDKGYLLVPDDLTFARETLGKLADIALPGVAYTHQSLVERVKKWRDDAKERGRLLADIAHNCGRGDGFTYRNVPAIVQDALKCLPPTRNSFEITEREQAIAKHFYEIGQRNFNMGSLPTGRILYELAKVKQ